MGMGMNVKVQSRNFFADEIDGRAAVAQAVGVIRRDAPGGAIVHNLRPIPLLTLWISESLTPA